MCLAVPPGAVLIVAAIRTYRFLHFKNNIMSNDLNPYSMYKNDWVLESWYLKKPPNKQTNQNTKNAHTAQLGNTQISKEIPHFPHIRANDEL